MKIALVLLTILLPGFASACFTAADSEYAKMVELYNAAQDVFNAEEGQCDHLKDNTLRSECICNFRHKPLEIYRLIYNEFKTKHLDFGNDRKYFCFSSPANEKFTLTIQANGYKAISTWCSN
ncbi:hypothetical protein AB833_09885 [Chromatiales bacterium (ex Bugula neritina AB1)]|nr:hypothetical protein AB833_09885 [Chromatiales bacterium (ex Bugula neritina AB1)]